MTARPPGRSTRRISRSTVRLPSSSKYPNAVNQSRTASKLAPSHGSARMSPSTYSTSTARAAAPSPARAGGRGAARAAKNRCRTHGYESCTAPARIPRDRRPPGGGAGRGRRKPPGYPARVSAVPYRATFVRLLGFLRPYRRGLAVSIVLAVGSQACQIALIWVTGQRVIDQALLHHDHHQLWLSVAAIAGLGLLSALFMAGR